MPASAIALSAEPSDALLHAALHRSSVAHPDVIAYIDGEQRFSFADVEVASRRLAIGLLQRGLLRGDRIAVLSYNRIAAA